MLKETEVPLKPNLTQHEIKFLDCVHNGLSNKQIAEQLNIAVKTVESRKFNLVKKLNLKSTRELISYSVMYFLNLLIIILTFLPDEII